MFMKIDVQGFESSVIKGAEKSLQHIDTLQLEMSLIPLYKNEMLFDDMLALLTGKGYQMVSIEPGFADADTGRLLQVDGTFHRF